MGCKWLPHPVVVSTMSILWLASNRKEKHYDNIQSIEEDLAEIKKAVTVLDLSRLFASWAVAACNRTDSGTTKR